MTIIPELGYTKNSKDSGLVMIYEKIIAFLLLFLYIFTFGRKSLWKYLEGGVSINIREEVLKNVEPPGKFFI